MTYDIAYPITNKQPMLLFAQSRQVQVKVRRIISLIDRTTGKELRSRPKFLGQYQSALIEIESLEPL
jgi:translation elongation factor EF-1alpha